MHIDKTVPPIKENDKIKFVFVKVPNPYGTNGKDGVMGFINKCPPEFELKKYIDLEKQFEKTFYEPLDNILQVIKWSINQQVTLESFFG